MDRVLNFVLQEIFHQANICFQNVAQIVLCPPQPCVASASTRTNLQPTQHHLSAQLLDHHVHSNPIRSFPPYTSAPCGQQGLPDTTHPLAHAFSLQTSVQGAHGKRCASRASPRALLRAAHLHVQPVTWHLAEEASSDRQLWGGSEMRHSQPQGTSAAGVPTTP